MRGPLLLIVSSLLIVEVLPASGQAQVIEIRPGSVRAPLVRVQRGGRLRDRIRGRLQDEETDAEEQESPLQQRYPGALTPPPVPPARPQYGRTSPAPFPQTTAVGIDRQSLQTSLILAEAELDGQLSASASAAAYRKYLRVGQLSGLMLQNPATELSEASRQQLQEILDVYNRTQSDSRQQWVSRLSGFEKIQAGLTQLLAPEEKEEAGPEHVSVETGQQARIRQPMRTGEPQPTQVLPPVRNSR